MSKHTEKILKLCKEIDVLRESLYSKKSYWHSGNAAGYNNLEQGLDVELNSK